VAAPSPGWAAAAGWADPAGWGGRGRGRGRLGGRTGAGRQRGRRAGVRRGQRGRHPVVGAVGEGRLGAVRRDQVLVEVVQVAPAEAGPGACPDVHGGQRRRGDLAVDQDAGPAVDVDAVLRGSADDRVPDLRVGARRDHDRGPADVAERAALQPRPRVAIHHDPGRAGPVHRAPLDQWLATGADLDPDARHVGDRAPAHHRPAAGAQQQPGRDLAQGAVGQRGVGVLLDRDGDQAGLVHHQVMGIEHG